MKWREKHRVQIALVLSAVLALVAPACETERLFETPGEAKGFSRAYGIWTPGPTDTCTKEQHDKYSVVGPDGLLYPTWHPAIDPDSGCTFGHEHGRDPRGSDIYGEIGPLPFAYANQQLDIYDPLTSRHEDHFGHKVEWENDVVLDFDGAASAVLEVRCDVLVKLHQGTHSKDAFTNNLHELIYNIRCNDGTAMSVTLMAAIGTAGEMVASCDGRHITVGPPSPLSSPDGGGQRRIPDRVCVERHMLVPDGDRSNFSAALHESWETSNSVRTERGHTLASFDPYFQVEFPSRFYDPSAPNITGRPIEMCYITTSSGERAQGELCRASTGNGAVQGMQYDDPRSKFNGVARFVDINGNRISNSEGPEFWYSDPFGRHARTTPFPGSIKQYIAKVDNTGRGGQGPVLGRGRNYGGPGVRAPN
jgi:hypothetical protein